MTSPRSSNSSWILSEQSTGMKYNPSRPSLIVRDLNVDRSSNLSIDDSILYIDVRNVIIFRFPDKQAYFLLRPLRSR